MADTSRDVQHGECKTSCCCFSCCHFASLSKTHCVQLLLLFYLCSIFVSKMIPIETGWLLSWFVCKLWKVSFVAEFSCYLLLFACLQMPPFLTMVAFFFLSRHVEWEVMSLSASLPVDCHQVLADYPVIHIMVTRSLLVLNHCSLDFGFLSLRNSNSFLCCRWQFLFSLWLPYICKTNLAILRAISLNLNL